MKSPARLLHDQVMGCMHASKEWKPAEHAVDRGVSKGVAALLILAVLALAVVPLFLDFLPARVALRALVVSMMVFGLAARFWHGLSIASILGGVLRYWIPFGFLGYMYYTGGKMAILLFKEGGSPDYLYDGGFMILGMAILGGVTSWVHVDVVRKEAEAEGTTCTAKVLGLRAYALVWFGFFLGGALLLAMATGLADWFFVDVLGW